MVAATTKPLPGAKTPGITRTYTRVEQGRPQRVSQYQNHKMPQQKVKAAPKAGKSSGDYRHMPTTKETWRDINQGDVLDFGGEPWKVMETYVGGPSSPKNKAGKPNTKGTTSGKTTRSKGKGVNTSGPKSATKPSTTPVTNLLENLWTGKKVQITLHPSFVVWVY